jgi:hypothetical protein
MANSMARFSEKSTRNIVRKSKHFIILRTHWDYTGFKKRLIAVLILAVPDMMFLWFYSANEYIIVHSFIFMLFSLLILFNRSNSYLLIANKRGVYDSRWKRKIVSSNLSCIYHDDSDSIHFLENNIHLMSTDCDRGKVSSDNKKLFSMLFSRLE